MTAWDIDQKIDLASEAYGLKVKDDDGGTTVVTVSLVGGTASYTEIVEAGGSTGSKRLLQDTEIVGADGSAGGAADNSSTTAGSITFQLKLDHKAQLESPIKIVIAVADSGNAKIKTEYFIELTAPLVPPYFANAKDAKVAAGKIGQTV